MRKHHSWLFYGSLVAVYLSLNSILNLTNKWVLSSDTGYGFSFPLLLTSCHMAFSFLALLPMMLAPSKRDLHVDTLQKQWRGLAAVGVFMALNISLNNTSLVWLALSVNQVIRYGALFVQLWKSTAQGTTRKLQLAGVCGFRSC